MGEVTDGELEGLLASLCVEAHSIAVVASRGTGVTADDLLQDACIVVLGKPEVLRPGHEAASFVNIVKNLGMTRKRSEARRARRFPVLNGAQDMDGMAGDSGDSVVDSLAARETAEAILRHSRDLAETDRRVVGLLLQGMTPAEISMELGISSDAVRVRTHRIRKKLGSSLVLQRLMGAVSALVLALVPRRRNAVAMAATLLVGGALGAGAVWLTLDSEPLSGPVTRSSVDGTAHAGGVGADSSGSAAAVETSGAGRSAAGSAGEQEASAASSMGSGAGRGSQGANPDLGNRHEGTTSESRPRAAQAPARGVYQEAKYYPAHEGGGLWMVWSMLNGVRHGVQLAFDRHSRLEQSVEFVGGKPHGLKIDYDSATGQELGRSWWVDGVEVESTGENKK